MQTPSEPVRNSECGTGSDPSAPCSCRCESEISNPGPQPSVACSESDISNLKSQIPPVARAFLCQFLARAYEYPKPEVWKWMCGPDVRSSIAAAIRDAFDPLPETLREPTVRLLEALDPPAYEDFLRGYHLSFGHAARGSCPLNEIEYGDLKADPLFQPHRLADLGAFYRAFGLEVAEDAAERHDHLSIECEFMSVLHAKEAHAIEEALGDETLLICRDAQKKFMREHLGRWAPAFARRLARQTGTSSLAALADFTRAFIELECRRLGVPSGNEDLLLRSVDEDEDTLCTSCGIRNLPPGALTTT